MRIARPLQRVDPQNPQKVQPMPIVRMPNGDQVSFPDDMPKEQIRDMIAKKFPVEAAKAAAKNNGGQQTPAQPEAFHGVEGMTPEAIAEAKRLAGNQVKMMDNPVAASSQGLNIGAMFNFNDEIGAGMAAPFRAAYDMSQGNGFDLGRANAFELATNREAQQQLAEKQGGAMLTGEIAGGLAAAANAGGNAVNAAKLLPRALQGAAVAGTQGALHGAGAGETHEERAINAGIGGAVGSVVGAAAPYIGDKVANIVRNQAQKRITNQAIKTAPTAQELKGAASKFFDAADGANISFSKSGMQRLMDKVANRVGSFRPNAQLDPKTMGALKVLQDTFDDTMRQGSNVVPDLKDLHIMRQAAQRAAMSSEGRDAMLSGQLIDSIDDFVKSAKLTDTIGGKSSKEGVNNLFKGMSTWRRAQKTQLIEDAIELAQDQASGFENGLRINLRKILNNKALSRGLSEAEKDAIRQVVRGTTASNLAKLVGKFGFGHGNASNMMGGSIGMLAGSSIGGLPGGIAAAALGKGGRIASEKLTEAGANRAMRVMATPNLKSLPAIDSSQQKLLEVLLRGSAPSLGK